jgi:GH43 family beta-xylosidase
VACADTPLGPFENSKMLFDRFTIDAHVVETSEGLFLFYAEDDTNAERVGTRIYVDKLSDPYTPQNLRVEVVSPTFDEEIFERNRFGDGKDWHTIEGPFWFEEKGYQYLMYSGGCYKNDTYHIGYASAKTTEPDLTKVEFKKASRCKKFSPVIIKNDFEEGPGHHSVIKYKGEYYAVYHGRDIKDESDPEYTEQRTARVCCLIVKDGKIKAER